MRRLRARLLGGSVVAVVAFASVAYGDFFITPPNASTGPIPTNTLGLVIFSIRNTGTSPATINNLLRPPTQACMAMTVVVPGPVPFTIPAGKQVEIEIDANAGFVGPASCTYSIDSPDAPGHVITAQFNASATPEMAEIQPTANDFGTPSTFEIQTVKVIDYAAGSGVMDFAIIGDTANAFSFQGCGTGDAHNCSAGTANDQILMFSIQCDNVAGSHTASLTGKFDGGASFAPTMLTCNGTASSAITVAPSAVTIATSVGVQASTNLMVNFTGGSDSLIEADMSGADSGIFKINDARCQTAQSCVFSPGQTLSFPLEVDCTPTDNVSRSALLTVRGNQGPADAAFSNITCNPNGAMPIISFSTTTINAGSPDVFMPSAPQPLTITNIGGGTLMVSIQIPSPASNEWSASGCVSSMCNLTGMGSAVTVDIALTPLVHGNRGASLTVISTDNLNPSQNITLNGSGLGGVLDVTNPAGPTVFAVDFGIIPKNQVATRTITMVDTGNAPLTVAVTPPGSPYSVDSTSVGLAANNGNGSFMAHCSSATSSGASNNPDHITLASAAYQSNTTNIDVTCQIADTDVQVVPTSYDFGEVRIGGAPVPMTVTVTNPTTGDVTLSHLQLDAARPGLSLTPSDTSTTLHGGDVATATITLDPTTETDLEGVDLAIAVDGTNLSFPIHGKVVTPAAHVVPATLDLGTACLGSQVTGMVALVNDGTATLNPSPPMMDQSFTPLFVSPTSYPTPLPPMLSALVGITPSSSATGPLHGTLTWAVDAPNSPFIVPVSLVYIATGAAVSPNNLDFGELEVGVASSPQVVTLENCNTTPVTVTTHGVLAAAGTVDAWKVDPQEVYPALAPHQTIKLNVAFAPQHAGHYDAQLQYDIDGTAGGVELFGDGHGGAKPTSFYACSCNGPGAPAQGWPVGAAIVLVVVRRRRRPRSS